MALSPGTRLGSYAIGDQIGVGGMGEVYRATDTDLGRQVAIKVLPDAFAQDAERLARFEREAKTLASLNHPNIAIVHGVEAADGVRALVMELVEGETLAERIARGPIPTDEALPLAREMAAALEAAHEQSIVHRDLKPANVKVRDDGTVKVLDFGLAKVVEPGSGIGDRRSAGVTMSPTITTPAMTQIGVILGTAAYMSPEQAKGREADKRSDIWAFGAVVYEMLTGRRAFDGDDMSETLAAVIKSDPDWTKLPADAPLALRTMLRTCLQKDPRKRTVDATTALFVLDNTSALVERTADAAADRGNRHERPLWKRALAPVMAVVVTAAVVAGVAWISRPGPSPVVRTTISTTDAALEMTNVDSDLAITPDGSRIVYRGSAGFFVRALDQIESRELTGLGNARSPFVSPDGQWVGYFEGLRGTLNKVNISGGPPLRIVETWGGALRGATWGPDGTIVFGDSGPRNGLFRVSSDGGMPVVLTRPDPGRGEGDHVLPEFLPGGRAVLFTIIPSGGTLENAQIAVLDLRTGMYKTLVRGATNPHYVPSGHLVFSVPGTLRAIPFDLGRLEITGTQTPVVDDVITTGAGAAQIAIAANGTMVYVAGRAVAGPQRMLVWVDRTGKEEAVAQAPVRAYQFPRLSPDGTRVALDIRDQENDIEIWDFSRKTMMRLTSDPGADQYPVWTLDNRIIFASSRGRVLGGNLYSQAADGTGTVERLIESANPQQPHSITPDGSGLIIREGRDKNGFDLFFVPLRSPGTGRPLVATTAMEVSGEVSPDGRWLAYHMAESGPSEVVVRPFPNVDTGSWQVSRGGGRMPLWSRDGRELFYVSPDNVLMGTRVEAAGSFRFTSPMKVLGGRYFFPGGTNARTFDISPDGQRFLMIKPVAGSAEDPDASPNLTIVQHWFEELTRLVPQ